MKVLLLAGTAEARALAQSLAKLPGFEVTASLAGATSNPRPLPVPTRIGGFGGTDGLSAWLRAEGVEALVDATHPFAERMPWNAAQAAASANVPRLRLLRPEWPARGSHRVFPDLAGAFGGIPAQSRVLATVGRLKAEDIPWRTDCAYWLRSIDPAGALPGNVSAFVARPPFPLAREIALMRRYRITHLVTKNSGGDGAKLDAAEALSIAVHMIARPPQPPGPFAEDIDTALAWVAKQAHTAN